ncbi:MAG: NUDIX domain-containing protein [Geminicoccaceae bacterium]
MSEREIYRPVSATVLSDDWGVLTKYEYDLRRRSGEWQRQAREAYDRGNGATCLLHNRATDCVLLTRQFRLPVFLNGGLTSLIETPAGLLDGAAASERMRAELMEETGFEVTTLEHLFDVYMSPGSVTEYLSFFIGSYAEGRRRSEGGGDFEEGEDIEVLHIPLPEAMAMIETGEIRDAKTIILLQHLRIGRLESETARC